MAVELAYFLTTVSGPKANRLIHPARDNLATVWTEGDKDIFGSMTVELAQLGVDTYGDKSFLLLG